MKNFFNCHLLDFLPSTLNVKRNSDKSFLLSQKFKKTAYNKIIYTEVGLQFEYKKESLTENLIYMQDGQDGYMKKSQ